MRKNITIYRYCSSEIYYDRDKNICIVELRDDDRFRNDRKRFLNDICNNINNYLRLGYKINQLSVYKLETGNIKVKVINNILPKPPVTLNAFDKDNIYIFDENKTGYKKIKIPEALYEMIEEVIREGIEE